MTLRSLIRTATAAPIACRPEDPIFTAVDLMAEHDRNAVLVTSGSGLMRGIVTDQDIIRHLHKQRGRIGELCRVLAGGGSSIGYGELTRRHIPGSHEQPEAGARVPGQIL